MRVQGVVGWGEVGCRRTALSLWNGGFGLLYYGVRVAPREDGHGTRRLDRETRHGLETEDNPVVFAGASASAEIPFAMARGRREI